MAFGSWFKKADKPVQLADLNEVERLITLSKNSVVQQELATYLAVLNAKYAALGAKKIASSKVKIPKIYQKKVMAISEKFPKLKMDRIYNCLIQKGKESVSATIAYLEREKILEDQDKYALPYIIKPKNESEVQLKALQDKKI